VRYLVAAVWIALAVLLRNRRFFAYAGSIVAMVHLGGLGIGKLAQTVQRSTSEPGPSIAGFVAGIALGVIAGAFLGGPAYRNSAVYWVVQAIAAGFLLFLPLFRF
jgi:predicted MFS family arabinose efflux permease